MSEPSRQPLPLIAVPAGRTLIRQDEPAEGRWVIVSGALRESCVSAEGREFAVGVLGPGDGFGGGSAGHRSEVRALLPSRIRAASEREWTSLLEERERRTFDLACELVWFEAAERLEMRLRDLADRFGRPSPAGTLIEIPLTQSDLAALAGTTRERANRIIRRMARSGRVSRSHRLYVLRSELRSVV